MTLIDNEIDYPFLMYILSHTRKIPNIEKRKYSSKELLSFLLPDNLNLFQYVNSKPLHVIKDGQIITGNYNKSDIANILQKIWFSNGDIEAANFLSDLQKLAVLWLTNYGLTFSLEDIIIEDRLLKSVKYKIQTHYKKVMNFIVKHENNPFSMTHEAAELFIKSSLEAVLGDIENLIMSGINKNAGLYTIIKSGAKGIPMNAAQMVGCLGQTIVEGKRLPMNFHNRSLPFFYQHDNSPTARGFIMNSFLHGLNPSEFFLHTIAGREGLIFTSIKTAETGYTQRKLVKLAEDIQIKYDDTVRGSSDRIIQFMYGDNGINVEKQVDQYINLLILNNKQIREQYIYSPDAIPENYSKKANENFYQKLIHLRDKARLLQLKDNTNPMMFRHDYKMPVDMQQYIINLTNKPGRKKKSNVTPTDVLNLIKYLLENTYKKHKEDDKKKTFMLKVYFFDLFTPRKVTNEYFLTKQNLEDISKYYFEKLLLAKIEPGTLIGFITAQSIGEPVTQSNLKIFHKAGIGKNVSLGLPRLRELMSLSENIKTPNMTIYLKGVDENLAKLIASDIQYTVLEDIIEFSEIFFDPFGELSNQKIFDSQSCSKTKENLSWLLKLTLNKELVNERNIQMIDIKTSFCINWEKRNTLLKTEFREYKKIIKKILEVAISTSYDNDSELIVNIYFDLTHYNLNSLVMFQRMILNSFKIKGVKNITKSKPETLKSISFDKDGNKVINEEYILDVYGINLLGISQYKDIDLDKTFSNHITVIYETYGIEAARSAFIREFSIAAGESGVSINYQHIELLADSITFMGILIPVDRYGANKLENDPLSKASFEKMIEKLSTAAVFGESDYTKSISSQIMVGKIIQGGTGSFDLSIDTDKLKEFDIKKEEMKKPLIKKNPFIQNLIKK